MQHSDRASLACAAMKEQASALEDFSAATERIALRLGRGEEPSNADLAREESAFLRLQNARALRGFGLEPDRPVPRAANDADAASRGHVVG